MADDHTSSGVQPAPPEPSSDSPQPGQVIGMPPPSDAVGPVGSSPEGSSAPLVSPPLPHQPEPLHASVRKLLLITGGILCLVALAAGFLLWQTMHKKDSTKKAAASQTAQDTPQTDTTDISCQKDFSVYQNQDVGFGFCYPEAWGAVSIKDAKFAPVDTGKRWQVSFADKTAVHLNLKSKDWSTKQGRDGLCADLAADMPDATKFSNTWETTIASEVIIGGLKGIKVSSGKYLIQEEVDSTLLNGVCLEAYTVIDDASYTNTTATYTAAFSELIPTPEAHIADSEELIPGVDRSNFATFAQSVVAL